jgi:hypothetical protein
LCAVLSPAQARETPKQCRKCSHISWLMSNHHLIFLWLLILGILNGSMSRDRSLVDLLPLIISVLCSLMCRLQFLSFWLLLDGFAGGGVFFWCVGKSLLVRGPIFGDCWEGFVERSRFLVFIGCGWDVSCLFFLLSLVASNRVVGKEFSVPKLAPRKLPPFLRENLRQSLIISILVLLQEIAEHDLLQRLRTPLI